MSKNPNKHRQDGVVQQSATAVNEAQQQNYYSNTPPVLAWVVTTVLFITLSGTVAPLFWSASFNNNNPHGKLQIILGVAGILAFFIEPLILKIYEQPDEDRPVFKAQNQGILRTIANGALFIFLLAPMSVIFMLRPILRAMLLIISFSYLNIAGPESALTVIVVLLDIGLYYLGMFSPKLSLPAFVVTSLNIKAHPRLLSIGALFFIFYNALFYFFITSIGYYKGPSYQSPNQQLLLLILFWLVATIYIRSAFMPKDTSDMIGYFQKMPGRYFIFQVVILAISFIAYMWPYFTGWR